MADYKIGTMFILSADAELKDFLGDKTLVNKGTKIWVGADGLAHYQDGTIQPLPENAIVKGYDGEGIAERIYMQLASRFLLTSLRKIMRLVLRI